MDDDLEAILMLVRTQGVGPRTYLQWMREFSNAREVISKNPKNLKFPEIASIQEEMRRVQKFGARMISIHSPLYPPCLKEIHAPPIVLTVKGNVELLLRPSVGIVGARNASSMGKVLTKNISKTLGENGFVVTSGLARGIDAAAHQGAMETGTMGVIGGGINVFYPQENKGLQEEICEKGLVISIFAFGEQPTATHFPKRNHIISGLSKGIVVVEAALKSGSLITANAALEQNREVMAVPGSPLDPRCQGTNKLLKDGAVLIENGEDVLQALGIESLKTLKNPKKPIKTQGTPPETTTTQALLENLSYTPIPLDQLIKDAGTSPHIVHGILLELELEDKIERHPGNKISLKMT